MGQRVTTRNRWLWIGLVLVLAGLVTAGVLTLADGARSRRPAARRGPNIVFVLTDDLAWDLVSPRFMPHVAMLERRGETFDRYFVSDSLCCPSRTSIFTGLFPHDSGVFSNTGSDGGWSAFIKHRLESRTFAVAIQRHRYLTSMMGKYLNGYGDPSMTTYVPPGWSDWHVAGQGYSEFNYDLNENGRVVHYGLPPPPASNAANYLTDVLASRATGFINRAASAHRPFVVEVATFAPHYPYVPAPRNAHDFPGLKAPHDASFNTPNLNAPDWLRGHPRLTRSELRSINHDFRMRVQADEAVDRLLARIEATVAARHLQGNTYIVFSSDNGYHMGQHRLLPGKMTAFDSDIRVPLIVAGPGVPAGRMVTAVTQNIDLYPTFLQLTGSRSTHPVDGHSLVPLLHPGRQQRWRTLALVEHHGPNDITDPDFENGERGGNPPAYEAIRISDRQLGEAVYVEYTTTGQREYYDLGADPFERRNIYTTLSRPLRRRLHRMLLRLERCHGPTACWAAGGPQ